jgi:hypothetical protein
LDKLAKFYAWFLLVTTVLPALLRLALPDRVADITLVRFKKPGGQKRYRVLGAVVALGSLLMLPLFFLFYPDQRWILFAVAVGVLSGGEMFVNASWPETLIPQNRAFGAVYAIAAVAVYWFLLRG